MAPPLLFCGPVGFGQVKRLGRQGEYATLPPRAILLDRAAPAGRTNPVE